MSSFATPAAWTAKAVRAKSDQARHPHYCLKDPTACVTQANRAIEHYNLRWRGIEIIIVYTPDFHAAVGDQFHHCHLEVMSERPRAPLPISETGYRSVFLPGGTIEDSGGALQYATQWLEHAAKSLNWKSVERDKRQGTLF